MKFTRALLLSVIFFAISELYLFSDSFFWSLFFLSFLFSLAVSWYFLKKASLVTKITALSPIAFSLFYLIQDARVEQFISFALAFCFYLLFKPEVKRSYLIIISFLELLLIFSTLFAYNSLYGVSLWVALLITFLASFTIFFSSISSVLSLDLSLKVRLFYFSLIVAIVISELYWLMTKFPFNFITSGFVVFLVYYAIWDISIRYFASSLTKRSVYAILLFLLFILLIIFVTARFFFI